MLENRIKKHCITALGILKFRLVQLKTGESVELKYAEDIILDSIDEICEEYWDLYITLKLINQLYHEQSNCIIFGDNEKSTIVDVISTTYNHNVHHELWASFADAINLKDVEKAEAAVKNYEAMFLNIEAHYLSLLEVYNKIGKSLQPNESEDKLKTAVKYIQKSYVADSKELPALLIGDVVQLVNILIGSNFDSIEELLKIVE